MKKYRVQTDRDISYEYDTYEQAEIQFKLWKDSKMNDGVVAGESYVEIVESEDDFEDYRIIKGVIAAIDHDQTELRTPREEGFEWDYWAKWVEMDLGEVI